MFCGKDESAGPMDVEHFVPRGLWDGPRPDKTITLPAHVSCNSMHSADNEYFRDVLAVDAGAGNHVEVQKLQVGKLRRKLEKKPGSMLKSLDKLGLRPVITPAGLYLGDAPSFTVDWPRIVRVLQNVVRGIYYKVQGKPLSTTATISIVQSNPKFESSCSSLIETMHQWIGFGDDVFACRYVSDNDHADTMACLMRFYQHRTFFGIALCPELQPQLGHKFSWPST
jgi:hypothetical protein